LAQHWGQARLHTHYPGIDAVVGLKQRDDLPNILRNLVTPPPVKPSKSRTRPKRFPVFRGPVLNDQARLRLTEPCWSYLRIAEGCSMGCAFCTIPAIRGPFRSKNPDAVLAEAAELIADGALELNLIAQETSRYGRDLDGYGGLGQLLWELNRLEGLKWLRVLYTHPASISDDIIDAMSDCETVVPYLDMPLQHINDRLLKLMHRRINRIKTEKIIKKLRDSIDNLTMRTTMLVGFPTETDAEFTELLDFVREMRFDALGGFAYSLEPGTPAGKMTGQIPDKEKQRRLEELMLTQQAIAFTKAEAYIGRKAPVLLLNALDADVITEMKLDANLTWFTARHPGQAPDIDSVCYLSAPARTTLKPGRMVKATITQRQSYDLIGQICR
ncbi:MAG: MiaB/RimO family radical SAM methylthiotransferase, partial [Sedimentisphaerales bacterium]|nr:MiaB/RimO family radical SAM methylthiotransferase [Sedimentisphaerales bacterium]